MSKNNSGADELLGGGGLFLGIMVGCRVIGAKNIRSSVAHLLDAEKAISALGRTKRLCALLTELDKGGVNLSDMRSSVTKFAQSTMVRVTQSPYILKDYKWN